MHRHSCPIYKYCERLNRALTIKITDTPITNNAKTNNHEQE